MSSLEKAILYPLKKEPELALVEVGQKDVLPENGSAKIIEFPQEKKEEDKSCYEKIVQNVFEMDETYTEKMKRRYTSFAGSEELEKNLVEREKIAENILNILPPKKTEVKKERVTDENAQDFILSIVSSEENVYAKNQAVATWINEGGRSNFLETEKIIAGGIKNQQKVSMQALALLAEIWQTKEALIYPSGEIMEALECAKEDVFNCLNALGKIDSSSTDIIFHKMIDFVSAYLVGCQNGDGKYRNGNSIFFESVRLLRKERENVKNYLVASHLKDLEDTFYCDERKKKGVISGMPGGASDKNIYTFKSLIQSYHDRIKLGVNEGFVLMNPVIQIAPGYLGMYSNGKVARIFSEESMKNERETRIKQFIATNDPRDEEIYDKLNEKVVSKYRCPDDSYKLERLHTIIDFGKQLKENKRKFFYDISRLNLEDLHPSVIAEIMTRNQDYLNNELGVKNESPETLENEYLSKIFLTGKVSEEQLYNYFYFTNLSVRKKIEDDFGVDIGELDFATQRYFLSFLETRSIEDVVFLQEFVHEFGKAGLQTFLSCKYGNDNAERIIKASQEIPKEMAGAIFAKYGEIVENIENTSLMIEKQLKNKESINQEKIYSIIDDILAKGRNFLVSFFEKVEKGEELNLEQVLAELEHFRVDTIFFTSVFKNFAKSNPEVSFEDFKGLSFETVGGNQVKDEDVSRMILIAQKNYQKDLAMQKLVVESLQEGLQKENSQFFILRLKGEIVAFDRFDDEGGYFYVGSLNVDPNYRGSAIGETVMRQSFDVKAKEKPLQGITDPAKEICTKYVEDGYFIIDKILRTSVDGKILTEVSIWRDDKQNKNYEYRAGQNLMDLNLVYAKQQQELVSDTQRRSEKLRDKKPFLLKFDKETEMERFENLAERLIEEYGYVISRYLPADMNGKKILVVFEQKLS